MFERLNLVWHRKTYESFVFFFFAAMNFVVSSKVSMSVYEGFGFETKQIH